jgi:hypothetical protein
VQTVGTGYHQEYWIPAEELDEFNRHIRGKIEVTTASQRKTRKNENGAQM